MCGWRWEGAWKDVRPVSSVSPLSALMMPAMPPKTGADFKAGLWTFD